MGVDKGCRTHHMSVAKGFMTQLPSNKVSRGT